MALTISVVICTYNRAEYIYDALKSLVKQDTPNCKYEIIVVNNNSTDNTEEEVNRFIKDNIDIPLIYVIEEKQGLSHARNKGIKTAKGSIIAFVDDDAVVSNNYIRKVINFFRNHNNVSALGGKILPLYENERPKWMSYFLEPLLSIIDLGNKEKEFPIFKFPIGANMIFKKNVFDKIGNFNTDLGRKARLLIGSEEKDIFNRIRAIGGKIWYSPEAWVYHQIPDSRLKEDFIKKQAEGIGYSEKVRTLFINKLEFYKSLLKESFKWIISFILFAFYALTFQIKKSIMIIKFRFWVSSGLLKKNNNKF